MNYLFIRSWIAWCMKENLLISLSVLSPCHLLKLYLPIFTYLVFKTGIICSNKFQLTRLEVEQSYKSACLVCMKPLVQFQPPLYLAWWYIPVIPALERTKREIRSSHEVFRKKYYIEKEHLCFRVSNFNVCVVCLIFFLMFKEQCLNKWIHSTVEEQFSEEGIKE